MMLLSMLLLLAGENKTITYAAGYIPNIQFAPFYIADSRGYYAEEGIDLKMDYTIGPDVLKLVALGKVQIGSVDPDAFLHASKRGMPIKHIATLYQSSPIALIARDDILEADKLRGKSVGITGAYGGSYLSLKAILREMGLELKDINVRSIGYTQVSALQTGRVDAVVGYVNNEPLRLKNMDVKTHTRELGPGAMLPGVGLMTSKNYLNNHKELVEGFLRATFRGMHDVISDPEGAYAEVVEKFLPELSEKYRFQAEREVLMATLPYWKTAYIQANGYGQCDPMAWERLVDQLTLENETSFDSWIEWIDTSFQWKPK